MALGDSMVPEFSEGEIFVIEMGGPATEGNFVIIEDDFIFRQFKHDENGDWLLHALNPAYSYTPINGSETIKGKVTHKRRSGLRKTDKHCLPQAANQVELAY